MPSNSDLARFIGASAALLAISGCSDHLDRRDTIALSAGNSASANAAIQTIDHWPRHAFARSQPLDGQRAVQIMQTYRGAEKAGEGAAPAASTVK